MYARKYDLREEYHIGLLIKIWFCKSDFMTIEKTLMKPVDTILIVMVDVRIFEYLPKHFLRKYFPLS